MFFRAKVTKIYCSANDFCKESAMQQEKYVIVEKSPVHKYRTKPNCMDDAEIMAIIILFHPTILPVWEKGQAEALVWSTGILLRSYD